MRTNTYLTIVFLRLICLPSAQVFVPPVTVFHVKTLHIVLIATLLLFNYKKCSKIYIKIVTAELKTKQNARSLLHDQMSTLKRALVSATTAAAAGDFR